MGALRCIFKADHDLEEIVRQIEDVQHIVQENLDKEKTIRR